MGTTLVIAVALLVAWRVVSASFGALPGRAQAIGFFVILAYVAISIGTSSTSQATSDSANATAQVDQERQYMATVNAQTWFITPAATSRS